MPEQRILYCHCAYSKVIAEQVKTEVLRGLANSGVSFEAVADICEMSARSDPELARLADGTGELRIAACYPRAVRWLFSAAGAPLPDKAEIRNMRTERAQETIDALLAREPRENSQDNSREGGAP